MENKIISIYIKNNIYKSKIFLDLEKMKQFIINQYYNDNLQIIF